MKRVLLGLLLAGFSFSLAASGADDWVALFNGKDLTGWKSVGRGHWRVEDGAIAGVNDKEKPGNYWLMTEAEYGDFILRLKFWVSAKANSGVAIRDPSHGAGPQTPAHLGYEIQIIDRPGQKMPTGSIYTIQPAIDGLHRSEQWNEMEIRCQGPHIEVWLNGVKAAETEHTRSLRGAVGFQLHDREELVKFKDVLLKAVTSDK
jgi:hypothetical protein